MWPHQSARTRLVALCLLVLGFVLPESASALTLCAQKTGSTCCYSEPQTALSYTGRSDWGHVYSYRARRRDQSGVITYEHNVSPSGNWSFTNSVDAYRRTTLKNNGSTLKGHFEIFSLSVDNNCNS